MTAVRKLFLSSAVTALVASGILVTGSAAHAEETAPVVVEQSVGAETGADTGAGAEAPRGEPGADQPGPEPTDGAAADGAATADLPEAPSAKGIAPKAATVFGTLKVSPAGPYTAGQSVKLTYTGFPANSQIVASTCVGGIKLGGPGDCAPLNGPSSAVSAADGKGGGTVTLKVVKGLLGATDKPTARCSNKAGESCVFSLTDFGGNGPATIKVVYKEAAAEAPASSAADDEDAPASSGNDGDDAAGDAPSSAAGAATGTGEGAGADLAATGAGPASSAALAGYSLVVAGLVLLLMTRRTASASTRR